MMKIRMGYPSSEESVEILRRTVASRSVDDFVGSDQVVKNL